VCRLNATATRDKTVEYDTKCDKKVKENNETYTTNRQTNKHRYMKQ